MLLVGEQGAGNPQISPLPFLKCSTDRLLGENTPQNPSPGGETPLTSQPSAPNDFHRRPPRIIS